MFVVCPDFAVQQASRDSSSWLSAPQIEVQAASPLAQSPASEGESAEAERESFADDVVQTTVEIADLVEDRHQEDISELSGLEMPRDSEPAIEVDTDTRTEEHFEEMEAAVVEDQPVPVDEEELVEGRLSADTSEQIFISQQIEALAALDGQQPSDTRFPAEDLSLGLDEPEHVTLPTDSLGVSSSDQDRSDVDKLQSPYKTSIGSVQHRLHNIHIFIVESTTITKTITKTRLPFNQRQITRFFFCDLDLDPMTLLYELDLRILKMYTLTKSELSGSKLSEVIEKPSNVFRIKLSNAIQ